MEQTQRLQAAKEDFDRDGFIQLTGFLSDEEFAQLKGRIESYLADTVPRLPREDVFYEDKNRPESVKQLMHMDKHDSYFHELISQGRFHQLAEILLEGPVVAQGVEFFNKPAKTGLPTPAHQDGYYFKLDPCEAITIWLPMEEVNEENGCLRYLRGSHRKGLRPHNQTDTLGFSQGVSDYGEHEDLDQEVVCAASPGDLLTHHALTIHRAEGNTSPTRSRKALGLVYYSTRAKQDKATLDEYMTKLNADLAETGKI